MISVYHIFIHLSVSGHIGCFHVLATCLAIMEEGRVDFDAIPTYRNKTIETPLVHITKNSEAGNG